MATKRKAVKKSKAQRASPRKRTAARKSSMGGSCSCCSC